MANLTNKELRACPTSWILKRCSAASYQAAAQECTEADLKNCFQQYASQHKQNFETLLNFLK